ncbi:MAD2L1-binding protein-like [Lineus longissimus]|uniref:MAD2L1-binding protein-like n=1 Tax=Lineus longissimus TaxID=88925 RepID=UPI002B4E6356
MSLICRPKPPEKITWKSEFDGVLSSHVCGILVVELLKFLAFERHQLPAPFDQIKGQVRQKRIERPPCIPGMPTERIEPVEIENCDAVSNAKGKVTKVHKKLPVVERKRLKAVQHMDEILQNVELTFKNFSNIEQVLIILGSTPVSPKESFLIRLPHPGFYEGRLLSAKSCKSELFRKLVSCDLFSDLKQLSSTNFMVFILAPRNSGLKWFQPKFSFKMPTRGHLFEFSLVSTGKLCNPEITQASLCDLELSGIEPLEKSQNMDSSERESTLNKLEFDIDNLEKLDLEASPDDNGTKLEESLLNNASLNCGDSELVWFQAPISMRGFKIKNKKHNGADDIWG